MHWKKSVLVVVRLFGTLQVWCSEGVSKRDRVRQGHTERVREKK